MNNSQICAFCKHFQEPFGFYDQNCRCAKTGRYIQQDNTCNNFLHMYSEDDDFYHDINDEFDDRD